MVASALAQISAELSFLGRNKEFHIIDNLSTINKHINQHSPIFTTLLITSLAILSMHNYQPINHNHSESISLIQTTNNQSHH